MFEASLRRLSWLTLKAKPKVGMDVAAVEQWSLSGNSAAFDENAALHGGFHPYNDFRQLVRDRILKP